MIILINKLFLGRSSKNWFNISKGQLDNMYQNYYLETDHLISWNWSKGNNERNE